MKCPGCGSPVDEGADLCLECGEPMGDSPVARAVRAESPSPSPSEAQTKPIPKLDPFPVAVAKQRPRKKVEEPEPIRCPGCGIPSIRERCHNCGSVLRRSDD